MPAEQTGAASFSLKSLGPIPILFVILWTIIFTASDPDKGFWPLLSALTLESALCFMGASFLGLAALRGRRTSTLFLCCASLSVACATLSSGLVLAFSGLPADARLVLQAGMFLAALMLTVSGLAALGPEKVLSHGGASVLLVVLVLASALLYAAVALGLSTGMTSAVLMPWGAQFELAALLLFCVSTALLLLAYRRTGRGEVYWSALAIIFFSAGLGIGMLELGKEPIIWVGRVAESIGAVYFVIAGVSCLRALPAGVLPAGDRIGARSVPANDIQQPPEDEFLESDGQHGSRRERLLHAVFASIPEGILVIDRAGRIVLSNPAAKRILGRTLEVGRNVACEQPIEDTHNLPLLCSILDEQEQRNLRMTMTWPDGQQKSVMVNSAPLKSCSGELIGAVAVYHDRGNGDEPDTDDRFRSFVETLPEPVALFDGNRRFLYTNEAFRAKAGAAGPLDGLSMHGTELKSSVRALLQDGLDTVFSTCVDTSVLFEEHTCDGTAIHRFHFVPEFDATGAIREITAIGRENTGLMRRVEALGKEREELELKVRMQGTELLEAVQAKNEFMANMSHEIRTPLAGILGLTEITLESELPAEVRHTVEMIYSSAQELTRIVDDILDFARIESHQLKLKPVDFDLREMLETLVRGFNKQAMNKGLKLTLEMKGNLPRIVFADPFRLGQILRHLISNAIKFTQQGGVRILVGKQGEGSGPIRLVFVVEDTGIGIPAALQPDIFTGFKQLDSGYTKRYAGTGLGLAISRELAGLMNGTIEFESQEGKGSVFVFRIEIAGRPLKALLDDVRGKAHTLLAGLPSMAVLLAGEDSTNQLFLNAFLTEAGHEVAFIRNGCELLEALERERFDLVLMDIQMEEMNGIEVVREIRSGKRGKIDRRVPIIALTTFSCGDRVGLLDAGMDGCVSKPVDHEELALEIRRAVRMSC
jgi:PAS domain S-box-containing protein